MKTLRIATRGSILALWQANHVKQQLSLHYPELCVEIVEIKTTGDKVQDKLLAEIGGKGLFIKELETALLADKADIAVHSMKDVPPTLPLEFTLSAMLPRADVRDAFISQQQSTFNDLPTNAIVGTCSPRRQAQLLKHRPDLIIKPLRGNVDTRLKKLAAGEFDAIILAAAGLQRLGLEHTVTEYFTSDFMLPAVGQGAIGIECLSKRFEVINVISSLNHIDTELCVKIERDCVRALNGNCHSPIGVHAKLEQDMVSLTAAVFSHDGQQFVFDHQQMSAEQALVLGEKVATELLQKNAAEILQ